MEMVGFQDFLIAQRRDGSVYFNLQSSQMFISVEQKDKQTGLY